MTAGMITMILAFGDRRDWKRFYNSKGSIAEELADVFSCCVLTAERDRAKKDSGQRGKVPGGQGIRKTGEVYGYQKGDEAC